MTEGEGILAFLGVAIYLRVLAAEAERRNEKWWHRLLAALAWLNFAIAILGFISVTPK